MKIDFIEQNGKFYIVAKHESGRVAAVHWQEFNHPPVKEVSSLRRSRLKGKVHTFGKLSTYEIKHKGRIAMIATQLYVDDGAKRALRRLGVPYDHIETS